MSSLESLSTESLTIVKIPKEGRKSPATLRDMMNLQDGVQEFTSAKKPIFERKIVEVGSVGLAELMGLDYSEYPGFSEFLLSLVHEYELFYLSEKQNPGKCVWEIIEMMV
jgi:hypothetical protein